MKRKTILILIVLFLFPLTLFSSVSFLPEHTFFSSFKSDLLSSSNNLEVFYEAESNMEGQFIRFDKKDGVPGEWYLPINDYNKDKDSFFLHLQTGGSVGFLRFGKESILEMQLVMDAHISSVFYLLRGNDNLGFDGVYFMGGELKALDSILLRGGIRHFSGHVGDEAIFNALGRDPSFVGAEMTEFVEDAYEVALGYDNPKFPYLKGAFGLIVPKAESYMMPFVHRPDWITSGGKDNSERDPLSYGVRGDYGASYNGLTLYSEMDGILPFSWGSLSASYIITLYESGKTKHTLSPLDDQDVWEVSHELRLSLALENGKLSLSMDGFVRKGRFPLLSYYWRESTIIGFGFSLKG